ncbi:MAG TPA: ABC transporter ATP-binding protein [Candidatus Faecousia intestinigallinarum]|nr:ABC transporter ATP-binding protein [Candidatus Faecousia intestinigallinarum]
MKQLNRYIRPYYGYIALAVFIKLVGAVLELFIPYLMEQMLDVQVPAGDLTGIYLFGAGMILCAAGCLAANIWANRMSAVSSGKITLAIRHDLFEKLQSLSARQMDTLTISSAESRLTSDTYNINQLLARVQRLGIRAPILLLGGVTMMLGMDAPLALVLIAMLPIIAVVVYFVTKTSVPLYTKQQGVLDKVVRTVQENITGIRVIKALSKTDYEKDRFRRVNQELTAVDEKAGVITSITNPTSTLVLNLGLTLVVVAGAFRVNGGGCQSGVIVAFLQYFTMILNAMLGITRIFVMYSKGEASAKRVANALAMPADLTVLAEKAPPAENAPHIAFQNVTFSYTGRGNNLENLSFSLQHGQCLGILGPTGSGKSTILNLLLRLYDPDSGVVAIDGRDIRTIPREELQKKFGVVFQNDFVAQGTIGENLRFFRELDDAAIARAAGNAQADFITEKPGGMDAPVTVRGNNLSGGQKQRLLIGRALAGDPEILVLDDASSALDYRTDANLRHALARNYARTTTVIVAQRVSSLRHADLILVLDDGRVIGMGSHGQLMEDCPEYRAIANAQMGEGKEAV